MKEPIARYHEVRPAGQRQFQLFEDRVVVNIKSWQADSVITVRLADLRPEPNSIRTRPREFGAGIGMLFGSLLCGFVLVGLAFGSRLERAILLLPTIIVAMLLGSLLFIVKTFRKIEFTQFVSHQGTALLDVARSGPQRGNYDSFVETLIAQVRANQPIEDEIRGDDS